MEASQSAPQSLPQAAAMSSTEQISKEQGPEVKELQKEGELQGIPVGIHSRDGDSACTQTVADCATPILTATKENASASKLDITKNKYAKLSNEDISTKINAIKVKISTLKGKDDALSKASLESKKEKLAIALSIQKQRIDSSPQARMDSFRRMSTPELRTEIKKLEQLAKNAPNNSPVHTDLYNAQTVMKRNKILSTPLDILDRKIKTLEKRIEVAESNNASPREIANMKGELKLMQYIHDAKTKEKAQLEKFQKLDQKDLEQEIDRLSNQVKPQEMAQQGVGTDHSLAVGISNIRQGAQYRQKCKDNLTYLKSLPQIPTEKREKALKELMQNDITNLKKKRDDLTTKLSKLPKDVQSAELRMTRQSIEHIDRQLAGKQAAANYLTQSIASPDKAEAALTKAIEKENAEINQSFTQSAEGYLALAQLPPKTDPDCYAVMHRMADICCGRPPSAIVKGSVSLISSEGDVSSGGVYAVAVQHGNATINLMSWKPRDEAPGQPRNPSGASIDPELQVLHPSEEGVVSECIVHTNPLTNSRACLAHINHRGDGATLGVLTEFFASEGSIQGNMPTKAIEERSILRSKFQAGQETERDQALAEFDKAFEDKTAIARSWGLQDDNALGENNLSIWDHVDPSNVQMHEGVDTIFDNTDENAGNELMTSKSEGKENRVALHNLDFERTNPTTWPKPYNYNPPIYANTSPMNARVDEKTKTKLLKFDIEKEIQRTDQIRAQADLPPLSDMRKDMMRARKHLLEVGLNNNCTMEQIRRVRMTKHPQDPEKTMLQHAYDTAKSENVPPEQFWKRVDHHILVALHTAIDQQIEQKVVGLKSEIEKFSNQINKTNRDKAQERLQRQSGEAEQLLKDAATLEKEGKLEEATVKRNSADAKRVIIEDAKFILDKKRIAKVEEHIGKLEGRLEILEEQRKKLKEKIDKG